jgi:hypothetical protein
VYSDLRQKTLGFERDGKGRALNRIRAKIHQYAVGAWENPDWTLIFTAGRLVFVRRLLLELAQPGPAESSLDGTLFPAVSVERAIDDLRVDGIHLGLVLPPAPLDAMLDFALTRPCFGAFDRAFAFLPDAHAAAEERHGRHFLVASYLDDIEQCPALCAVRDDPLLKTIAAAYLRTPPVLISTRLWWSFPSPGADDDAMRLAAQNRFHSDINDWRSVKFFFYLTEVDAESGPHMMVRGTHWRRPLRHQLSFFTGRTGEDLAETYGMDRISTICGPAGFGFAEDPFTFHTGTTVRRGRRLILQIEYGVSKVSHRRFYGGN